MQIVGNYVILPVTVRSIIDPSRDEASKSGRRKATKPEEKKKSFPIIVHYLYFRHVKSGLTWRFVGVKRNGAVLFSDGRDQVLNVGGKPKRITSAQLVSEVGRLVGNFLLGQSLVDEMMENVVKCADASDMLAPWNDAIDHAVSAKKSENALSLFCNKRR